MRTLLQVEELERRDMPSALNSLPSTPPARLAAESAARRADPAPFVDAGAEHSTARQPTPSDCQPGLAQNAATAPSSTPVPAARTRTAPDRAAVVAPLTQAA